ncbi:hypothetical protein PG995_003373 [Apiospora arundinis]
MAFILGLVARAVRDAARPDEHHHDAPPCGSRTPQYGARIDHQYQTQQQGRYAVPPIPFGNAHPSYYISSMGPTMPMTKRERRGARRAERHCRRGQRHNYYAGPSSSYQEPYRAEEVWAPRIGPYGYRQEESYNNHNTNNIGIYDYGITRDAGPSRLRPLYPEEAQRHSGRQRNRPDEVADVGEEGGEELPPPAYEDVVTSARRRSVEVAPVPRKT